MLHVSAVLPAVARLTLLLPRSLTLSKQDSAIPSSSHSQLPAELKAETQNAAQTGKSNHDKTRQHSGCPEPSQLHKPSSFYSTCSQHSGPSLPKEQLSSTRKEQCQPFQSEASATRFFPQECSSSQPWFNSLMIAIAHTHCPQNHNTDANETFLPFSQMFS